MSKKRLVDSFSLFVVWAAEFFELGPLENSTRVSVFVTRFYLKQRNRNLDNQLSRYSNPLERIVVLL